MPQCTFHTHIHTPLRCNPIPPSHRCFHKNISEIKETIHSTHPTFHQWKKKKTQKFQGIYGDLMPVNKSKHLFHFLAGLEQRPNAEVAHHRIPSFAFSTRSHCSDAGTKLCFAHLPKVPRVQLHSGHRTLLRHKGSYKVTKYHSEVVASNF